MYIGYKINKFLKDNFKAKLMGTSEFIKPRGWLSSEDYYSCYEVDKDSFNFRDTDKTLKKLIKRNTYIRVIILTEFILMIVLGISL